MPRIWKRLAADEQLATEFRLAVRELRDELGSLRTDIYVLRKELEVLADGSVSRRLERLRQQLAQGLGMNLPD